MALFRGRVAGKIKCRADCKARQNAALFVHLHSNPCEKIDHMEFAKGNPQQDPAENSTSTLEETISRLEHEVAAYKAAEARNIKSLAFLNGILDQSLAGIYVIYNGAFTYANQSFADIFGYASADEIIGKMPITELIAPECRDLVLENIRKRTAGEINDIRYSFTGLRKDGSRNVVEVHGRSLVVDGNRSVVGLILDMTNYERVSTLAFYDSLTKLPNRALFHDRLERVIARAQRNQENFALLFIDLDGFKKINDNLGHAAGDHVLQETARRLVRVFRESDTVCRLGGDEFVAILTGAKYHKTAAKTALRIIASLKAPIRFLEHTVVVSASIGISFYPHDGEDIETLLHQADSAMYEAKKAGKNSYRFASG